MFPNALNTIRRKSANDLFAAAGSLLLPCVVAMFARLAVLGRPPFTDDGWYASVAWFARLGEAPIAHSPIGAYPRLLAWVFGVTENPMLWFRVIDGLFAVAAAAVIYLLLRCLAGACGGDALQDKRADRRPSLAIAPDTVGTTVSPKGGKPRCFLPCAIACLWTLATNHPKFVDGGFKNQITAATVFLCASLIVLCVRRAPRRPLAYGLAAGVLAALACLTRETFAPFAAVVAIACIARLGARGLGTFVLGGAITGLVSLSIIAGGPAQLLEFLGQWNDAAAALANFSSIMGRPWATVWLDSAQQAWRAGGWTLPLIAAGVFTSAYRAQHTMLHAIAPYRLPISPYRLAPLLGFALILAPLPEMLLKLAFPYHFAQFLLGGAVLCVSLGDVENIDSRRHRIAAIIGLGGAVLLAVWPAKAAIAYAAEGWRESRRWWPVMVLGEHRADLIRDSFYLRLTDSLIRAGRPNDRALISGFYFGPLALSRTRPASGAAADATFLTCTPPGAGRDAAIQLSRQAKPRIIIESSRIKTNIREFIPDFPDNYTLFEELKPGSYTSYSPYDAKVWVRND